MDKAKLNILYFIMIVVFWSWFGFVYTKHAKDNTTIQYQGKRYVLYSLVGEGYTHKNRVPVYHPVFVPEEQAKNAF